MEGNKMSVVGRQTTKGLHDLFYTELCGPLRFSAPLR
jgi:hypothetical protein